MSLLQIILFPLLLVSLAVSASSLPDLSSSTSNILTIEEQNRLGDSLYQELKESGQLNDDPVVNSYINILGQRLLAASPHAPHTFTFFVIDNPQINAFAMFGGYIGIYSGLIRAAETESELASVIAHEIAHITQDHLRRALEKSSNMGVPVTVAVLAAILLGKDTPELAEAALTTVIAGQQQQQLSFTRSHEREADRLGIERLSSANFNPAAMVRFFALIQDRSRYSAAYPEYLQTHPITTERVSEAQDRARQLPKIEDKSSLEFSAIQARLTLSQQNDSEQLIRDFSGQNDVKGRYILILALMKNQQHMAALKLMRSLQQEFPDVLSFQLTKAAIYQAMNNWKQAEASYQAILNISPNNRLASKALVALYLSHNESTKGKELLLKLAQHAPLGADELRLLAKIASLQGDKAEMHLNLGNAFILEKRYSQALEELLLAQKYVTKSFYLNNRIEARIEEVKFISASNEHK